jgi:hypothetical protein
VSCVLSWNNGEPMDLSVGPVDQQLNASQEDSGLILFPSLSLSLSLKDQGSEQEDTVRVAIVSEVLPFFSPLARNCKDTTAQARSG